MHPIKKLYCRLFQGAFRLAMPFLPYREPKLLTGCAEVGPLLAEKGIGSALIVTDPGIVAHGLTAALEASLEAAGVAFARYDRTRPNPTVSNVEEALACYREHRCEAILAIGGGSAIDCAKAVGARVVCPDRTLDELKGLLRVWRRLPLFVAIPTIAGTGSEVTVTAVITDDRTHHKYTMNNFTFIPHYAVHDPALTCSLPPQLTATTGMDALTHAVEAYIGRSTTRETRTLARKAVRLVFAHLEDACRNGEDLDARKQMLSAAYMAGIAFSKSYVGYVHAIAHTLGGQYDIPHGLANAVLLPYVLEGYGPCVHPKLAELAVEVGVAQVTDAPDVAAKAFIDAIRVMNRCLGIPSHLQGIDPHDVPQLARHAAREANPLYPVPRLMDAKELELVYAVIAEEEA